jgi:hypothetical protein
VKRSPASAGRSGTRRRDCWFEVLPQMGQRNNPLSRAISFAPSGARTIRGENVFHGFRSGRLRRRAAPPVATGRRPCRGWQKSRSLADASGWCTNPTRQRGSAAHLARARHPNPVFPRGCCRTPSAFQFVRGIANPGCARSARDPSLCCLTLSALKTPSVTGGSGSESWLDDPTDRRQVARHEVLRSASAKPED